MAGRDAHQVSQPRTLFQHTCFLYSPLRRSTSNLPYLGFLPEEGGQQGGPFGVIKCGALTRKDLLTTKDMGPIEFRNILAGALSDARRGRSNGVSANQCATQRLLDFDPLTSTDPYSWGRELSEIYIITYENGFADTLMVEDYDPVNRCVVS